MADCAWVSVHASLGWPDDTTKQIDGGTLLSALALGVAELLVMGSFCSCFTRSQRKYASIIMRIAPKLMALTMAMLAPESLQRLLGCVTGAVPVLGKYNGLLTLALTWGAVAYQVGGMWVPGELSKTGKGPAAQASTGSFAEGMLSAHLKCLVVVTST